MSRNHYFFALPLPLELKQDLHQRIQEQQLPFARFVHEQDLHLTLAFLGAAEEEPLQKAISLMASSIKEIEAFPLVVEHLGFFGKKTEPRIFWAGVQEESRLNQLQAAVSAACREAGFTLDNRPFRPHITIARKWKGETSFQLPPLELKEKFLAESVVLYETYLDRSPKYKIKEKIELHKGEGKE
ncbi:RNA 2',3'-cyclic phosphodiesterase [Pseudobacillus wudalianchiensis]|uniref:RNA 2',3'-cyclic phosphodiesterase n=1 Tax=Pseudobacillus wudalianchiensis TaxID=1743143 RepID=A0A1B9B7Z1_9BACI|nr:RNA 2',3'-cyclic phosphodiesterase [Bacillus wudalianchiensis]OCA92208.1 2'-5' RNA ligase [Bacillus wudalianchiensis]